MENPFSKKFQSYDAAIEKELWDSLGIVGTSDDDQNFGKLSMEVCLSKNFKIYFVPGFLCFWF